MTVPVTTEVATWRELQVALAEHQRSWAGTAVRARPAVFSDDADLPGTLGTYLWATPLGGHLKAVSSTASEAPTAKKVTSTAKKTANKRTPAKKTPAKQRVS